jgi:hypothetical protein
MEELVARVEETGRTVAKASKRTERAQTDLRRRVGALERLAAGLLGIGDAEFQAVADEVVAAGRTLLGYDRLYTLWQAVGNTAGVGGAFAELGTYRGGSAHFLALAARHLRGGAGEIAVLDTFEGHPAVLVGAADQDAESGRGQRAGKFADTSLEAVSEYLAPYSEIDVRRCVAPEGLDDLPDRAYALVHLDMDLYEPTLGALRYFAPRLARGGVIVLDDFRVPGCPGVEQAFREFFRDEARHGVHAWDLRTEQLAITKL